MGLIMQHREIAKSILATTRPDDLDRLKHAVGELLRTTDANTASFLTSCLCEFLSAYMDTTKEPISDACAVGHQLMLLIADIYNQKVLS